MHSQRWISDYNLNLTGYWLVGISISIGLAFILWQWETKITESRFESRVHQHNEILRTRMSFAVASAGSVAAFFAGSEEVTRTEFGLFIERLRKGSLNYYGIQAVEWIPRVKATDRAAYEAAAREDGYKEFVFSELDGNGDMVPAGDRGEYYPVYFVEPYKSNKIALGFDLASSQDRLKAMEKARDTNQQIASGRITLVQEQDDRIGFLLFTPVYDKIFNKDSLEGRRQHLDGFILIVYRVDDLLRTSETVSGGEMDMYIFDNSAPEGKQLLYPYKSSFKSTAEISKTGCVTTTESVGGRSWSFTHCPKGSQSLFEDHLISVLVLLLGVVTTFFVTSHISLISKQRKSATATATEFANLIDTANAPIFGIDLAGKINEWNRKAEDITGLSRHAVLGDNLVDKYITDDRKEEVRKVLSQTLGGVETSNYDLTLFTESGDRVDILLNSTTRRDAEGNITGAIGIGQDVTEIKIYQEQVIQASKLATLGEMSTSVAHELNQPLHTILMAASNINDHIENGKLTPAFLQKKLQRIKDQVERASTIINHMRMFGRIDDQKPQPFSPMEAMQAAISLVGEQLRLANIELSIDFANNGLKVIGNQIQLEQVFINIILNARDAILTKEHNNEKKITIHAALFGSNKIKTSITDTGGGIDENLLPRIFEPFFTTKAMGHGTGLGLSVSYGIIRDMHGSITAENTAKGTRISIIIPAAA